MKTLLIAIALTITSQSFLSAKEEIQSIHKNHNLMQTDSVLRHVVLLKFKEGATGDNIKEVEAAFTALPSKISEIQGYEWGLNNSPEGLDKGFTHCFFLTFKSEADRATYLPHPDHKAFGAVLTPYLEDVLVIDYWTPSE